MAVTATMSTPKWSARIATIRSPSIALPSASTASTRISVAVEGDAEIEALVANGSREQRKIGRTAALVDVRPVRLRSDDRQGGAIPRNTLGDVRIGAVRAVDCDAQPAEGRAEVIDDALEVAR